VVAGESANDREVLRCFLEKFCPEMQGRIVFLNDKVPLRDAALLMKLMVPAADAGRARPPRSACPRRWFPPDRRRSDPAGDVSSQR
jgi:hypothetical protein